MTLVWLPGTLSIPIPAASNKKGKKTQNKPLFQAVVKYFYILSLRSLSSFPLLFSPPELKRADKYKYFQLS